MQKQNKQKITLIMVTALLLPMATPAIAQAPRMSIMDMKMLIALQNPKQYAQISMKKYGWGKMQFQCLNLIWTNESHWNYKAKNTRSTAFGIAQMLGESNKHPMLQIDNGLRYIKNRYEQPCIAWKFWRSHYWY